MGSAAGTLNEGFGSFSETLSSWFETLRNIDLFFTEVSCTITGIFTGTWC